jgi:ribosomal protein S18 acetylase RimI-like enzyme
MKDKDSNQEEFTSLTIRKFKESDKREVTEIFDNVNRKTHFYLTDEVLERQKELLNENLSYEKTWVIEIYSEVVGFMALAKANDEKIAGLYIKEGFQSKGYGAKLIEHIQSLKENLLLAVYKRNKKAIKFYKKVGFEKTKSEQKDNGVTFLRMKWHK